MRLCVPLVAAAVLISAAAAATSDETVQPPNGVAPAQAAAGQQQTTGNRPLPKDQTNKKQNPDKKTTNTLVIPKAGDTKDTPAVTPVTNGGGSSSTAAGGAKDEANTKDQNAAAPGGNNAGPAIQILASYSTLWNATSFVTPGKVNFTFVDGDFPTKTTNSSPTSPFIVGIDVLDSRTFQTVEGTGGSITDASSIVLQDLKTNSPSVYWELLNMAFNPSTEWLNKGGLGLNFIRSPLGACDFGFTEYTYDDTVDGSPDLNLTLFSIDKAPKMWATWKDVLSINPDIKSFWTPWSGPAWMKGREDGNIRGGAVLPEFEDAYARYLVRAMQEIKKKDIPIYRLSLQNEPGLEVNYPSTKMDSAQQARIGKLTRKYLDDAGLQDIKLLAWDFNWDNTKFAVEVFDQAEESFAGVAWHGYGGEPENQQVFNDAYPDKEVWFTEFTDVTQGSAEIWPNLKGQFRKFISGSINYGSRAIIYWNIVLQLDKYGFTTPQIPGTCSNCVSPFAVLDGVTPTQILPGQLQKSSKVARRDMLDQEESLQMRRVPVSGSLFGGQEEGLLRRQAAPVPPVTKSYKRTSQFASLRHLGLAIQPRSKSEAWGKRIGVTTTADRGVEGSGRAGTILAQVFRVDNVDAQGNSRFTLTILQQNDHYETGNFEDANIVIRFRGKIATIPRIGPGVYNWEWVAPKNA